MTTLPAPRLTRMWKRIGPCCLSQPKPKRNGPHAGSTAPQAKAFFSLAPRIQLNEQMGNAPEPDTKHFLNRDLYTHIKWGRMSPLETDEDGWLGGQSQEFVVGDSMFVGGILLTVDSLRAIRDDERPGRGLLDDDLALAACLGLKKGRVVEVHDPLYIVRGNMNVPDLYEADGWGLRFRIESFDPENETVEMTVWEHESVRKRLRCHASRHLPTNQLVVAGMRVDDARFVPRRSHAHPTTQSLSPWLTTAWCSSARVGFPANLVQRGNATATRSCTW